MNCKHCGFEAEQEFLFCPDCGKRVGEETVYAQPVSLNPMADLVLDALNDKIFLAVCILSVVSTIFTISRSSIDIISILMTVFLWLTYASARKGMADHKHLRCVSGTYYAIYVILNVVCIIFLVGLVLSILAVGLASVLDKEMAKEAFAVVTDVDFNPLVNALLAKSYFWYYPIAFLCLIALILINRFAIKPTHSFLKSIYRSVETGLPVLCKVKTAKNVFLIWGIYCGIIALLALFVDRDLIDFAEAASMSAANIMISLLIKEYLLDSDSVPEISKN